MNFEDLEITLVFVLALSAVALVSLVVGTRGGRYRALPGWIGFWSFFGAFLVVLSRVTPWVSFPILAVILFGTLREYYFLAPVRPQDRWAILFAYLSIPAILYPILADSFGLFLTIILLFLFLVLPSALSLASAQEGLLDSMGRVLLGLLVYVFCAAHLGWMIHLALGRLELFGILVLAAEFPQRLAGRLAEGNGMFRSIVGMLIGWGLAVAAGAWAGPWAGVPFQDGAVAGLLVGISATAGGLVTRAVTRDLALAPSSSRVGRAALLDRITPAVYAAPLYFHFLNHFA